MGRRMLAICRDTWPLLLLGGVLTIVMARYVELWVGCAMPLIMLFLVVYFAFLRYGADGERRTDLD